MDQEKAEETDIDSKGGVSVIIPTYNRGLRTARAVRSVLSGDGDVVLEIIVVDDGSTDGGCDEIEAISDKVRLIRQPNRGAAYARLVGIEHARAKYVTFLDSDDVNLKQRISQLMKSLHQNQECIAAFGTKIQDGRISPRREEINPSNCFDKDQVKGTFGLLVRNGCFVISTNILAKTEIALVAAQTQKFLPAANDYDLVLGIAAQGDFVFCEAAAIACERLSDGISAQQRDFQMAFSLLAASHRTKSVQSNRAINQLLLRQRLEERWPSAFVKCIAARDLVLAYKIFTLGLARGMSMLTLKRLYWAWHHRRAVQ
ncbi:glycosyltransferase family 2 protein [Gimesia maris]|uniref:glycosyltransferase family 2 protein n=1 Tax=Gimesia maris TaxID=122 RepID=UPI003A90B080